MPRRDFNLTVALGDGPNTDYSCDQGIAIAANGHDDRGMLIGKAASTGDDIIGWTVKPQKQGEIICLRTMFDGTIEVQLGPVAAATQMGDTLWLLDDETGRLTNDGSIIPAAQHYCGLALESGKVEGDYCEVYIFSQKYTLDDAPS